jgi:uncharacterized membrane protein YcaP (DUF421 family)
MDPQELLLTALRAIVIYVIMLAVLRISGKRAIGNFSAFDLLVALMLGEVVDEIIYGDVTFLQGLVPIVLITLLQYGTSWLSYWDHGWDKVLEGTPTVIVRDGQLDREGMRTERMNEKDVLAELRLGSIDDLREVKLAVIENDGRISILKHHWAEALQKGDVRSEAGRMKQAATGGDTEEEPPIYVRTDSPEALGLRE